MILRRRYCSDRMCGATDCSTCYGPGYDREDDDDNVKEDEEDMEEDEDEPEQDDGPEPSVATP